MHLANLHIDSVLKNYGDKKVLTDIFLSCNQGEIIGLFGRNGSGKSTLLKIIFGSLKADRKFIKIESKLRNGLFDNRKLLTYLPQDSFLPNHLKVKSIINLFCGKNASLVKEHKLINPHLNKKSAQLSGGERRLLEIWLIVHSEAKFVLIDEPFNGIAPLYFEEIKKLIRHQSKNTGFIITDHNYRNVLDLATRIIILKDGGTKEMIDEKELKHWGYIDRNYPLKI